MNPSNYTVSLGGSLFGKGLKKRLKVYNKNCIHKTKSSCVNVKVMVKNEVAIWKTQIQKLILLFQSKDKTEYIFLILGQELFHIKLVKNEDEGRLTGKMILHSRSNMNTGDTWSSSGYFCTVCTHTCMNSLVSDSVPVRQKFNTCTHGTVFIYFLSKLTIYEVWTMVCCYCQIMYFSIYCFYETLKLRQSANS